MTGIDLKAIQAAQKEWALKNFGEQPSWTQFLGMTEETGELAEALLKDPTSPQSVLEFAGLVKSLGKLSHAHLKHFQGIRGMTDEKASEAKQDAIGDVFIYMLNYCNEEGFCLQSIIEKVWAEVQKRDWSKDKEKGGRTDL